MISFKKYILVVFQTKQKNHSYELLAHILTGDEKILNVKRVIPGNGTFTLMKGLRFGFLEAMAK